MAQYESYYSNDNLDFEFENKDYRVEVNATAVEYHEPGRMYLSNGDPGYPPEDEFELKSVDSIWYLITDEDENEVKVKPTKEMSSFLNDWLVDNQDKFEC